MLKGASAGAIGTEANCDFVADMLHDVNPDIDVKCISDSGSLYPYHTHTQLCYPHILESAAFDIWDSITDQSCMEDHPLASGYSCFSVTTSYPYLETPILLVVSSEDTTIRFCYEEEDQEFWQHWRDELAGIALDIAVEKPSMGMFIPNCPFHGGLGGNLTYWGMEVPLVDGENDGDVEVARNIIVNFMNQSHPYQAIDDMSVRNPNCNK